MLLRVARVVLNIGVLWLFSRTVLTHRHLEKTRGIERHTRMRKEPQAQEAIEALPDVRDANTRLVCNEIAEQLSKNWRFKVQVSVMITLAFFALAAAILGIVGWSISSQRARFQSDIQKELGDAKKETERQITQEFKTEKVQKTVREAAAAQAAQLLDSSVDPSIRKFEAKVQDVNTSIDQRFGNFKDVLDKREGGSTSQC